MVGIRKSRSWGPGGVGGLVAVVLSGCAPEAVLQGTLSVDTAPPGFVSVGCPDPDRLDLVFSEAVTLSALRFSPSVEVSSVADGAMKVSVTFSSPLREGAPYVVDLVAEDAEGNSLSVLAPFRGRNDRPPRVVINEIRTEYSKPKVEFLEFLILRGGQLGGLSVVSSALGPSTPLYVFPPVLVEEGDLIVLHLRTVEAGVVDEVENPAASGGIEASPQAWDFWIPGSTKRLRKTDGVAILDGDGYPLDAVLFSESPEGTWKKEELRVFSTFLAEGGAWEGASSELNPGDGVPSQDLAPTRTLCRRSGAEDTDGPRDWYVTATGKATPGGVNSAALFTRLRK